MTNTTAISRSRVWSVLTTPAAIPQTGPRLKTNLGYSDVGITRIMPKK